FSIDGDEQPYVAKNIFDIGKGRGVGITKKINCSLLGRDLVRLKRLGWFRDRFEAFALGKGLTDLAAFEVSDAFMILVKKDDEEDVQSGTEDDSDEEDAYLIEPLRTSSVVTKYTGTFGSTRESDKLSATILTFGHYIMHDTACLMAFADLQGVCNSGLIHLGPEPFSGSRHKKSLVLFDPMTHTVKGQSGAGDHGEDGIKDAIESHLCNSFCKALDLSDQDVLLNSLRNRVSEKAEADDHRK
ncbi:kinase-like domain-containing protein, partial [Mycena rebaudengoi]